MPDSILTSLDLRNHQKHPKEKKNVPKNKVKTFFSGPLFAYGVPLKWPYIGPDEIRLKGELFGRIKAIKAKADQSEALVSDVCRA